MGDAVRFLSSVGALSRAAKRACPLVVVAVLAAGACKEQPAALVVSRLVLNAPPELDAEPAEREALRGALIARLESDRGIRYRPDAREATHVLHVELGSLAEPGSASGTEQRVRVRLRPLGLAPAFEAIGNALAGGDRRAALMAAFEDAWAVLGRQRALDEAPDDELVAALGQADQRIKIFAIQRLGARKVAKAVDALIALLQESTPADVALTAIGALIAIGDPRAAGPMIELARNKDPAFVLQVVFALGALGGPTAEGYLVTLASGHPVEAVRRGAEDALTEMARRRGP